MIPGYNTEPIEFKGTESIWTWSWDTTPTESIIPIIGYLFEACDDFLEKHYSTPRIIYPEFNLLDYFEPNEKYVLIPVTKIDVQKKIITAIQNKYKSKHSRVIMEHIVFDKPAKLWCKELFIVDGILPDTKIKSGYIILFSSSNDLSWLEKSTLDPSSKLRPKIEIDSEHKVRVYNLYQNDLSRLDTKEFNIVDSLPDLIKPINTDYYNLPDTYNKNLLVYAAENPLKEWYEKASDNDRWNFLEDFRLIQDRFYSIIYVGNFEEDSELLQRIQELTNTPLTIIPEEMLPVEDFHTKFSAIYYGPNLKENDFRLIQESVHLKKEIICPKNIQVHKALGYFGRDQK